MKVICISGKAQHGKDTAANILVEELRKSDKKVLLTHYADLLKYICKVFFNWNGEKDDFGRTLLQQVGTEGVRSKNPDYWVNFIISILEFFPNEWDYVIIPDTRFPNEIEALKNKGIDSMLVRVQRPNFVSSLSLEQQQHASEIALDDYQYDYIIHNEGNMIDLTTEIQKFCKYLNN